jgi:hypothetical protein
MTSGHEAESNPGGAPYSKLGELAALQGQQAELERRIELEARLKAFEGTAEFGILHGHAMKLSDISTVLGTSYLNHAGQWGFDEDQKSVQYSLDGRLVELNEESDTDYLRDNGIPVNLVPLISPELDEPQREVIAREAYDVINASINDLYDLVNTLATERPDIRIGREVTVWRNPAGEHGQPWTEGGWTIAGFLANGMIRVAKDNLRKSIPADELMAMNGRP